MKTLFRLLLATVLVFIASPAVSAQSEPSTPEEIVAAAYEAINVGDIEAYMALFAQDAQATIGPWHTFIGHEEIRAGVQESFNAGVQFEYKILEVDGGKVKTWCVHQPPDYDFPLEATEVFVVADGMIVFNSWDPTPETMALLMGPQHANQLLKGVYDFVMEGTFLPTEADPSETPFSMVGCLVPNGDGHIVGGARRLNFGGDLQSDTVDGTYSVTEDGRATLSLNAYQNGDRVAMEELACFVTFGGEHVECVFTSLSVLDASGATTVPVVGSAHGSHRMIR